MARSLKPRSKPKKPYPTFPLTAHPNGQWCKKIKSKVHFFGTWADPAAALTRYRVVAADLHAGRRPRTSRVRSAELTVKSAVNRYLEWQKSKMDVGDIGPRWFEDCRRILAAFAKAVGTHRVVSDLCPEDFQRYRTSLAKHLGVHALARNITAIKSMFKFVYENELIDKPVRYGPGFAKPSATQKRKSRQRVEADVGKRLFTSSELTRMIEECPGDLLGPVLLGINGGFGNTDVATLPRTAVDQEVGVVSYARPKTGIERVVPLWPETLAALESAQANKPSPEDESATKLVFLTPRGKPLVRQTIRQNEDGTIKVVTVDRLVKVFGALLSDLGIRRKGVGFYTLRHTFRTWADEVKDQHAIHRIMGHAIPGMSGIYVEEIGLERLRAVTDHVRSKLFG